MEIILSFMLGGFFGCVSMCIVQASRDSEDNDKK